MSERLGCLRLSAQQRPGGFLSVSTLKKEKGKSLRSRTTEMATAFKSYPAILLNRLQTNYRRTVPHSCSLFSPKTHLFRRTLVPAPPGPERKLHFDVHSSQKAETTHVPPGGWTGGKCSGWGNSKRTVVCVGNNTIRNNRTRINCVSNTHSYKPTFAPPYRQRYGVWP